VEEPSANPEAKIELKMVEKETKKPSKKEEMVVPDVVQLFQSPEVRPLLFPQSLLEDINTSNLQFVCSLWFNQAHLVYTLPFSE